MKPPARTADLNKLSMLSSLIIRNRCYLNSHLLKHDISSRKLCTSSSVKDLKTGRDKLSTEAIGVPNAYNPVQFEEATGNRWKDRQIRTGGSFPLFRMALPPPNITGRLHLGHALTVAIQDSIVRLKLMTGSNVEWIPGFDHAGIATFSVVQRKFSKKKGSVAVDKDVFQKELENFAETNKQNITHQLNLLGALLDWDKTYYTMDDAYSEAVREAFIHLFENGTIVRGNEIINWSCKLETTVSDVEVEKVQFDGKTTFLVPDYEKPIEFGLLYKFSYPLQNSDKSISVATSRPETMFGDAAIAVHPSHSTYSRFIGHNVVNPLTGKIIPVIGDSNVKLDFGTGAMKVTPAHDKADFAIGSFHKLPAIRIFTTDGKLNDNCGEFKGLRRFLARQHVIDFLVNKNAYHGSQEYSGSIGLCSRSTDIIEPILMPHWFFKTEKLTKAIIDAVVNGEVLISPDNEKQTLLHVLANARDWCLSRQIQWGHSIPAYYHKNSPNSWVAAQNKEEAIIKLKEKLELPHIGVNDVEQDPDVLDTWFSSALVPLTSSGWPNSTEFEPLSLMETGRDISVFWVWRMMLMSLALIEQFPFKAVLLHGIVTDYYGRKMSKSRGNVIDPMHIVHGMPYKELLSDARASLECGDLTENEYNLRITGIKKDYPMGFSPCGADAVRFALLAQDISDHDVKLDVTYLENCKHFCNKLWQAMRFYLLHKEEGINHPTEIANPIDCLDKLSLSDRWILSCLYSFVSEYEKAVSTCKFHVVTEAIRSFFLLNYCDVYLELVKNDFQDQTSTELHMMVMRYAFCTGLKLAHPFLPFVTEEIWFRMTEEGKKGLLLDQSMPLLQDMVGFENDEAQHLIKRVTRIAKELRHFKTKYFQGVKEKPQFYVELDRTNEDLNSVVKEIEVLGKAKVILEVFGEAPRKGGMMSSVFELDGGGNCRISFAKSDAKQLSPEDVLHAAEKLVKLQEKIDKLKKQMETPSFQKASAEAKAKLKRRLDTLQDKINRARGITNAESENDNNS